MFSLITGEKGRKPLVCLFFVLLSGITFKPFDISFRKCAKSEDLFLKVENSFHPNLFPGADKIFSFLFSRHYPVKIGLRAS